MAGCPAPVASKVRLYGCACFRSVSGGSMWSGCGQVHDRVALRMVWWRSVVGAHFLRNGHRPHAEQSRWSCVQGSQDSNLIQRFTPKPRLRLGAKRWIKQWKARWISLWITLGIRVCSWAGSSALVRQESVLTRPGRWWANELVLMFHVKQVAGTRQGLRRDK